MNDFNQEKIHRGGEGLPTEGWRDSRDLPGRWNENGDGFLDLAFLERWNVLVAHSIRAMQTDGCFATDGNRTLMLPFLLMVIIPAATILSIRDCWLKHRGRTDAQIRAASRASVETYWGLRASFMGTVLILGGIADYLLEHRVTAGAAALFFIGVAILTVGINTLRKAHALEKFVDS